MVDNNVEILIHPNFASLFFIKQILSSDTFCKYCDVVATATIFADEYGYDACPRHCIRHGTNFFVDPLTDIEAHAPHFFDTIISDSRPLIPQVCFQYGLALAPVIQNVKTYENFWWASWHLVATHALVAFSDSVYAEARHSVLFVVKYLPNCIKDIRVLIGKLLWHNHVHAWARLVPVPNKSLWKYLQGGTNLFF